MIEINKLRQEILNSLADLRKRYITLTKDDIIADIINVICNYIIIHKNLNYKTNVQPIIHFQYNLNNCAFFIKEVLSSLDIDQHLVVTEETIQSLTQNICFNLGWSEMPIFLNNYFSEKHGLKIYDDIENFDFMSIRHERYVNESIVARSQVDRNIKISCWNNRKDMSIEINPTLSLKRAYLINKLSNLYLYKGEDSDYRFEVRFTEFDEIDYISVSLLSRNLKLSFY
jgi:hypothetical protein